MKSAENGGGEDKRAPIFSIQFVTTPMAKLVLGPREVDKEASLR